MTSSISYLKAGGSTLDTRPPVMVAGASEAARLRGSEAAQAAGFRIATTPLDALAERLAMQAAASALWVEIEDDGGDELDRLLDRIDRESAVRQLPAVIAAPAAMLDLIAARIIGEETQILIDPGPAERAAALAIATAWRGRGARVSDITAEPGAARLRQLSDEVSRIAATLARLSTGPDVAALPAGADRPALAELPPVSADTVRSIVRARRLRTRYFDPELFADPAWDMLLDLFQADMAQHRVPVSFYEFTTPADPKQKRKDRWRFSDAGGGLIAIAGMWRAMPQVGEAYTMLTGAPGPDVAPYHGRQIVVLPPGAWGAWLRHEAAEAELLRPSAAGILTVEATPRES